jgi:hypothetical protein
MRTLTPELLAELYGQESGTPFLMLMTLSHASFAGDIYLVNNTVNVTSRGTTFEAFPLLISLPADDGETQREVQLELDNTSLELIEELRMVSTPIDVKMEMILSSRPNEVQISLEDLKIKNINYNKNRITAKLYLDDFLNTAFGVEKYTPSKFPGLY